MYFGACLLKTHRGAIRKMQVGLFLGGLHVQVAGECEGRPLLVHLRAAVLETPQQGLAKVQVGVEIYRNNGHVLALLGAQYRHGAHDEGGISNHLVNVCAGRT